MNLSEKLERAVADHAAGRLAEAEARYREILAVDPRHPDANHNIGAIAAQVGKPRLALPHFQLALGEDPNSRQYWLSCIEALIEVGEASGAALKLDESRQRGMGGSDFDSLSARLSALELANERFESALALHRAGRIEEAIAKYRSVLDLRPEFARVHSNLGVANFGLGRLSEAESNYRRALEIEPDHAEIHNNLGNALRNLGRPAEAVESFRRAIELQPDYVEAHSNLGIALHDLDRLDEAEASYRRALEIRPDYAGAKLNLANVLRELGQVSEARRLLEELVAADPTYVDAHKCLLLTLAYDPSIGTEAAFEAHRHFEAQAAGPIGRDHPPHANSPEPGRRLRIGYLSSDLRVHSVARTMLQLVARHDRKSFEFFFYAEVPRPDRVTEAFRALADGWRSTVGRSDREVADAIRADGIDILVCLAGRFDANRPLVCAYKPAPIQFSYGDVATSGLSAVDYLISDPVLTPHDTPERFTERLLRLPTLYLSEFPPDLPPILPRSGTIVFGCFNNPAKVSEPTLDLWARLLSRLTGSRLVLRYGDWYRTGSTQRRIEAAMTRHGVDPMRIDYPAAADTYVDHLRGYDAIDIALDTFPFSGSTTTFDALIMGVPVVTLPGATMVSRWSAGMLAALGHDDLIARSPDDFLEIALGLANDRARLGAFRVGLRDRVARSALCNAPRKARQIERLYRAAWRRWCAAPGREAARATPNEMLAQAIAHHRAGRNTEAEKLYHAILDAQPRHPDANHNLGVIAIQTGMPESALPYFTAARDADPSQGQFWLSHIDALLVTGQVDSARRLLAEARQKGLAGPAADALATRAAATGESAKQLFAVAAAHHKAGRLEDAADAYGAVLGVASDHADALSNLGLVLRALGRLPEAATSIRRAVEVAPDHADAHANLGLVLRELGRLDEAAESCRRAVAIRPGFAVAHLGLGNILRDLGRLPDSEASYRHAILVDPDLPEAHLNLGNTLRDVGRLPESQESYRRAIALRPSFAEAHLNLANVLRDLGRLDEAEASCRRALERLPDSADVHLNLGITLRERGRLDEAEASCRRAVELRPESAKAHLNLGNILRELGRIDAALAHLERAVTLDPRDEAAHRCVLMTLAYHPGVGPGFAFEAHRRFEDLAVRPLGLRSRPHENGRDPGRRLRIGYLSSDFRSHSAAANLLPLFGAHDRTDFDIRLYAEVARPDDVTARFRSVADGWRSTVGLSDDALADTIRNDRVDILVCLAGRFDRNRPLVCARRPAPVQISSHDVATSGLSAVDYLFSDRVLTPRGTPERFTERLLCLPNFYLAEIPRDAPPIRPKVGPIVFGCFNNPAKITDAALELWARLLALVPDSVLLLRYRNFYEAGSLRDRVNAALDRHGVGCARVSYPAGAASHSEHLRIYDEIDIALDTFPFSGSTTTFDALIMGVPVVTLPGWSMVSRWSATMLTGLGLKDLIASSAEDYLSIAQELSSNAARRLALRMGLRDQVARSSLCNAPEKARQVERFYRAVWRRWCASPERTPA